MGMTSFAPIMGIDRLRMGTDGNGITTLVSFYGCPLKCRFCLNPLCHEDITNIIYSCAEDVYTIVATDELYYLATGGGVTFGGGEPLLYSNFIIDVLELGAKKWNVTIETSMNIPFKQVDILLPYINEMIVDIKDINSKTYKSYTLSNNLLVLDNLKRLSTYGFSDKITIRVPLISGYNTPIDVQTSKHFLEDLGYSTFDIFEYKTYFK